MYTCLGLPITRDEKDQPFCDLTRTGFGADFEVVGPSDLGFGPDRSVGGPSESDRSDRTEKNQKVSKFHPCMTATPSVVFSTFPASSKRAIFAIELFIKSV